MPEENKEGAAPAAEEMPAWAKAISDDLAAMKARFETTDQANEEADRAAVRKTVTDYGLKPDTPEWEEFFKLAVAYGDLDQAKETYTKIHGAPGEAAPEGGENAEDEEGAADSLTFPATGGVKGTGAPGAVATPEAEAVPSIREAGAQAREFMENALKAEA